GDTRIAACFVEVAAFVGAGWRPDVTAASLASHGAEFPHREGPAVAADADLAEKHWPARLQLHAHRNQHEPPAPGSQQPRLAQDVQAAFGSQISASRQVVNAEFEVLGNVPQAYGAWRVNGS